MIMFQIDFSKKDFKSQARTLKASYYGRHNNGWTVKGTIRHNIWINDFEAFKGSMKVYGNFENIVYATSKKAYDEFIKLFPYVEWNYINFNISNGGKD